MLDGARCKDPCPSRAAAAGAAGADLLPGVPAALLGSSSKASSCDCRSLAAAGAMVGRRGLGTCRQAMTLQAIGRRVLKEPWATQKPWCQDLQTFMHISKVQVAASPGHEPPSRSPPAGCLCGAHLHALACPRQVWLAGWRLG